MGRPKLRPGSGQEGARRGRGRERDQGGKHRARPSREGRSGYGAGWKGRRKTGVGTARAKWGRGRRAGRTASRSTAIPLRSWPCRGQAKPRPPWPQARNLPPAAPGMLKAGASAALQRPGQGAGPRSFPALALRTSASLSAAVRGRHVGCDDSRVRFARGGGLLSSVSPTLFAARCGSGRLLPAQHSPVRNLAFASPCGSVQNGLVREPVPDHPADSGMTFTTKLARSVVFLHSSCTI